MPLRYFIHSFCSFIKTYCFLIREKFKGSLDGWLTLLEENVWGETLGTQACTSEKFQNYLSVKLVYNSSLMHLFFSRSTLNGWLQEIDFYVMINWIHHYIQSQSFFFFSYWYSQLYWPSLFAGDRIVENIIINYFYFWHENSFLKVRFLYWIRKKFIWYEELIFVSTIPASPLFFLLLPPPQ